MFRETGSEKKKTRGRQAGGLGSEAVHVRERERESCKQMCMSVCVCACVLSLLSFLCLTTEWGKSKTEYRKIGRR